MLGGLLREEFVCESVFGEEGEARDLQSISQQPAFSILPPSISIPTALGEMTVTYYLTILTPSPPG